ncbi:hypothetical protein F383_32324 [Gossypium arboreum]|uniref:Uncharacterized protein n=1 Tax=Gossypium arboreum TaxID=29729 RepID=A0A0B0MZZ7_GOSAR|nr:hypothetical protein F383_32324 [Gossypium arboreum]
MNMYHLFGQICMVIITYKHLLHNANVPDVVLHVITYRCHCPRQGLTHTHILKSHIDAMVLLVHIYRNPMS